MMNSDVGSFMTYTNVVEPKSGSVAWTAELETGIEILDEQHRHYIDLLNIYLKKATEDSKDDEKIHQLTESLDFLRQYAKEHFSTEESVMKSAEYPDFSQHLEEHLYFLKHVGALYKEMQEEGFSPRLSREVNYYIIEWFLEHILESDMQLVQFLNIKQWKI